jgi:hypothetical protein
VFQTVLDVAARTLAPAQLAALHAHLDDQQLASTSR